MNLFYRFSASPFVASGVIDCHAHTLIFMNAIPSENEFIALSKQGNLIPVSVELIADFGTPVAVYARLRGQGPSFLLESIVGGEHIGRYSFIGCAPRKVYVSYREETRIYGENGAAVEQTLATPADPLRLIEAEMAGTKPVDIAGLPPFVGGAMGFLGHEYIHCVEPTVPHAEQDVLKMPMLWYAMMDTVVAIDHARQVLRIISNAKIAEGATESQKREVYRQTVARIEKIYTLLGTQSAPLTPLPLVPVADLELPELKGNFARADFEKMVERTKDYIRSGDVIQVVGSQRFEIEAGAIGPLELYRALRVVNPSPYMFILETGNTGDYSVVGASPEVHVRATDGLVEIRPIAGTRPRGRDAAEDAALEAELLADKKERAEHLMLVDLARNDIGRVCKTGKVTVKDYAIIERYSHVMHIVSQVEGELAADKTAYDLMRATFPAGTLSGAPKVRALQIISEYEKQQRGVYGGALGYFSYNGNLDSCIAIRTALLKDDKIYIQSGAGLVADSVPSAEYMETINKAKGMLKAVALAKRFTS